ncbi:MAG: 2-iminoacetate synthase ThiH [Candidatus Omnitrophica bacterium]|nr:2-iminoacetate synthase ThiH [Candidatus Omnitrophota bacterium]MDE2222094.1 2-iminoacetate synthase ThiH [Candidatus Omnitrophota bacterium]
MMTLAHIKAVLEDLSPQSVEELARRAAQTTRQYFGRAVSLYSPLYLSNFCSSHCTYCGFHSQHKIQRIKLEPDQYRKEMQFIHAQGIRNILMLTGESYKHTPLSYLKEAAQAASEYFQGIALEVHPMQTDEYRELFAAGIDGIAVYQETYDRDRYAQVHLAGYKKDYDFRFGTPRRAAEAGMRHISLGILLGLSDTAEDVYALYRHLRELEKDFPGVEYSVSFPRLRTVKAEALATCDVDDVKFVKIICLTRLLFPRVGINLSTRETPKLRDHLLEIAITRMSAGSNTSVGGYTLLSEEKQDPQFDIKDERSVQEIVKLLKTLHFDPVFTDWRQIENPL